MDTRNGQIVNLNIAMRRRFLVIILILSILIVSLLSMLSCDNSEPTSPVSPLRLAAVEDGEQLDYLDGNGEIKWFDGFYTWNPTVQSRAYPFITGSVSIFWDDEDTGLKPVAIPYTTTNLVVELVLSGTNKIYTQTAVSEAQPALEPGTGFFDNLIWEWIDIEAGTYNEYIRGYWQIGNERIYIQLVRDGQVITQVTTFALYRSDIIIPELMYLPVVMKAQ